MRVLESTPLGIQAMGKKKHKLRKQSKENDLCPSDSSDESNVQQRQVGHGCPHLSKAINFNSMKKALKQLGAIGICTLCERDKITVPKPDEGKENLAVGKENLAVAESDEIDAPEISVLVCLQCGHQGCDRNSMEKHALKHFQTPRSASHAVAVNVHTWVVWCYDCDDVVAVERSSRLQDSLEYLRKQMESDMPAAQLSRNNSITRQDVASAPDPVVEAAAAVKDGKPNVQNKSKLPPPISNMPKVKGLSNLGNTCFFNAVMQNLSQTPYIEHLLTERTPKGAVMRLPGTTGDESDSEDSCVGSDNEDEKEIKVHLEQITISLDDSGPLTQSVAGFLRDMHAPSSRSSTLSPMNLFQQVCSKAPRFKGFQQQDSHELLRHLLDGMKAEEIKRSQLGILKVFQLDNGNRRKVDEETKAKIKEYGHQIKHSFVDSVFGGCFISTVLCKECKVPSQVFEPFQDISLPITEEKPTRLP